MSEITRLRQFSLDKLIANIDGKTYPVVACNLNMQLNSPATCQITLANGVSIRKRGSSDPVKAATAADAFTKVILYLYADGANSGLVIFRGVVTSVNRLAASNVAGSYEGVVLNCAAPQILMGAFSVQSYRYWGNRADSFSIGQQLAEPAGLIDFGKPPYLTTFGGSKKKYDAADGYVEFMLQAAGNLLETFSSDRYSPNAVLLNFEQRGRTIKGSQALANANLEVSDELLKYLIAALKGNDPYTALNGVMRGQLLMNLVPLMCGKMDVFPAFPWVGDPIATIPAKQILSLKDTTRMSALNENTDGVMIPLVASKPANTSKLPSGYAYYPPFEDLPAAGVLRQRSLPPWVSPFLSNKQSADKSTSKRKTNKASKLTNDDFTKILDDYESLATAFAAAFFAEIKNSGVSLNLEVPWYRLEFMDALGYLIKIEHPYKNERGATDDLYGLLVGANLRIQATPGGSSAKLQLVVSHVRDKAAQDAFKLDSNPLYSIEGGPRSSLENVANRTFSIMTRSDQIRIEGGSHESYLDDIVSEVENKKQ